MAEIKSIADAGDLADALEKAREGGLRLDTMIACAVESSDLRSRTLREALMEGAVSWEVAGELIEDRPRPFTTSLDASIAGENIILAVYSEKRGLWAAVQRTADGGECLAWGATEILARRAAALKGMSSKTAEAAKPNFPAHVEQPVTAGVEETGNGGTVLDVARAMAAESDEEFEADAEWRVRF